MAKKNYEIKHNFERRKNGPLENYSRVDQNIMFMSVYISKL